MLLASSWSFIFGFVLPAAFGETHGSAVTRLSDPVRLRHRAEAWARE